MVDFKKLKEQHAKNKASPISGQTTVVLGVRGSGKSATAGTFGDKKVLMLAFTQESHAADSARTIADHPDNIFNILVDVDESTGKRRSPEHALNALLEILGSDEFVKEFDVVFVDSLAVIDSIIANHPTVTSANGYEVKKRTDGLYDQVIDRLTGLKLGNKHVVITCPTEMRSNSADGLMEVPTLRGGSAVNTLIGACDNILFVKRQVVTVQKDGEPTEIEAHVFDFDGESVKKGTKMTKEQYILPIKTRVKGMKTDNLPARILASFTKLMNLKERVVDKNEGGS